MNQRQPGVGDSLPAVEAYLVTVREWILHARFASAEEGEIAQKILQVGGMAAVTVSTRIMEADMTPRDWEVLYDAYTEITRLVGMQMVTAQAPELSEGGN